MKKFTKDEIKKLESGFDYEMAVLEGFADPKGDTLLLESVQEELKSSFTGKTIAENKENEAARKELLNAFTGTKRPEIVNHDYPLIYRFNKNGIELSEEAERDRIAYDISKEKRKTKKTLTEAEFSSAAEEIREAFGGHNPDLEEAIAPEDLLLETITVDQILEGNGRPFTFKGRALKTDRRNRNNRRYGRTITEKALREAQTLMNQGRTFSVMSGHPRPGDSDPANVVGKVKFFEINPEGWMPYEATLSNTTKGMDLQKLLKDKCIGDVSLRSKGRTATAKMNGEAIDEVVDLHFRGLDLVIEGSEEGAGVDEIFNSAGAN